MADEGGWNKNHFFFIQLHYPSNHSPRIFYVFALSMHNLCLNIEFWYIFQNCLQKGTFYIFIVYVEDIFPGFNLHAVLAENFQAGLRNILHLQCTFVFTPCKRYTINMLLSLCFNIVVQLTFTLLLLYAYHDFDKYKSYFTLLHCTIIFNLSSSIQNYSRCLQYLKTLL